MSTTQCVSFSKTMFSSIVTYPYHLNLPREFCDKHLPRRNNPIILVGESEKEYSMKYLVKGHRVVGPAGWGSFVVAHGLIEGDKLLFCLIDKCKFKVQITRVSRSPENELQRNELADLEKLEDLIEENPSIDNTATHKNYPVSRAVDSHHEDSILCGIEKRVPEEAVRKEVMNHVKLALSQQYFSFYKEMQRSDLYHNDMRLPKKFCDAHLPCHDDKIILVDESEREYDVRYGVKGGRIDQGWRDFATACDLLEGDIVVFHLVDRCKFKVHIVRASRCIEKEFQNNMPLDFVKREDLTEENACAGDTVAQKNPVAHAVGNQMDRMPCVNTRGDVDVVPIEKVYGRRKYGSTEIKGAHDTHSAAPLGSENSESALNLKGFEDFKIRVNGEMLDSEIPVDIRIKYFELCRVEKRCLHDNVMKDLDSKLVVSMIWDIVSITESIKVTSISTRLHHLERMDNTLKSFEDLGMTVGSLRAKISKLIKILNEHHSVAESTLVRLEALECERKAFMEKKRKIDELVASAMAHGKKIARLEENVDGSKEKMDKLSLMLKEAA